MDEWSNIFWRIKRRFLTTSIVYLLKYNEKLFINVFVKEILSPKVMTEYEYAALLNMSGIQVKQAMENHSLLSEGVSMH